MSDVSFKAKIRPVTVSEFTKHRMSTFHKVDYPWTANETVKATKAYTTDIYDCTAGGIVDSHNNVVMFLYELLNHKRKALCYDMKYLFQKINNLFIEFFFFDFYWQITLNFFILLNYLLFLFK